MGQVNNFLLDCTYLRSDSVWEIKSFNKKILK